MFVYFFFFFQIFVSFKVYNKTISLGLSYLMVYTQNCVVDIGNVYPSTLKRILLISQDVNLILGPIGQAKTSNYLENS